MKRLFVSCILAGMVAWAAGTAGQREALAAEGSEAAVLKADQALQSAIASKNGKAAGMLLDSQFTWTNESGKTRKAAQFLKDVSSGTPDGGTSYSNLKAADYGQLAVVTGTGKSAGHANTFFARVWVKGPAGWRLLTHQDTAILAKAPAAQSAAPAKDAAAPVDCENPCRTLPVSPKTQDERDVFSAYQAVETAVTSHDPKTWADHVANEFVGIGRQFTGTPDTKAARVGQIGVVSNRVVLPKMLRGEAFVFGNAAIILADHQPVGEPPYHVIRVWVNRDGRWQLFHRQETTIQ
jgi:hypothetical protein